MTDFAPPPTGLERVFRADVLVGAVEDYGMTRAGHRRIVPILGGSISDGVDAEILPGGADWQVVRADGSLEIDTRYSARLASGHLLHLRTHGVRTGDPATLEAILRGAALPPTEYYFRIVVALETDDPALAALQDALVIASCARSADHVLYDAYRVL